MIRTQIQLACYCTIWPLLNFTTRFILFEDREPTEAELERWLPGIELGDLGREKIKGNAIEFYINTLQEVRSKTIETFSIVT